MRKREIFKVEGDRLTRLRKTCPKCGAGIFLAEHKDRLSCGSCGYTEFKAGGKKNPPKPVKEEKPVEEAPKEMAPVEQPEPPKEEAGEPEPTEEKPEETPESAEPETQSDETPKEESKESNK